MKKPFLYRSEDNAWGVPCKVRNFATISQLHCAMDTYAISLSPEETDRDYIVKFDDDSELWVTVERVQKTLYYRDYDGEEWDCNYFGKLWQCGDEVSSSPVVAITRDYKLGDDAVSVLPAN